MLLNLKDKLSISVAMGLQVRIARIPSQIFTDRPEGKTSVDAS